MARTFLRSRIETTVQETSLDCPGSITLPKEVLARADILPTEQVYVVNKTTGARFETYAIEGEKVCLNGGAARLAMPGDALIIMTFHLAQEHWAWLEQVLVRQQEVQKHPFISAFIHGHKHGKNSK